VKILEGGAFESSIPPLASFASLKPHSVNSLSEKSAISRVKVELRGYKEMQRRWESKTAGPMNRTGKN
jgi:hypothetical protein